MVIRDASRTALTFAVASIFFITAAHCAELTNPDLPDRTGIKIVKNALLHGAFKASETIDTNIFLANTDRRVDSITVLSPSLGLEVPAHNSIFCADYQTDIFMYGVNREQNYVNQRLRGLAEIVFADFYKFNVTDTFRIFTDRAANENSLRLKENTNNFRASASAEFNRLMVDVGYVNQLQMYDSTDPFLGQLTYEDRNYDVNAVEATVSYKFWPKTAIFAENDLGFIHYLNTSQVPDSCYDEALIGFKGEWFSKANVNFKAGFKYQHYQNSDVIAHKDYVGAVMKGGFDYTPTPNDGLIFEFDREIYESLYLTNNYYIANLFGVTWKHNFTPKIYSTLSGSYQLHQYPSETTENGITQKRHDSYYQASASLKYDLRKWISLEAKYAFTEKASNFDFYSYVDNAMTISGTIGF